MHVPIYVSNCGDVFFLLLLSISQMFEYLVESSLNILLIFVEPGLVHT